MRGFPALAIAASALAAAACGGNDSASGELADAPAVPMVNSKGEIIGEVRGGDSDEGAMLLVDVEGLPRGLRAIHIHDIGICEPPDFESAGPHWNPTAKRHGHQDPAGPHLGDLRNVTVEGDGSLRTRIRIPGAFLKDNGRDPAAREILDASGAALVIHEKPDDYRTNPSGNSGARIACAVLGSPAPGAAVMMGNEAGSANENAAAEAENVFANAPVTRAVPQP